MRRVRRTRRARLAPPRALGNRTSWLLFRLVRRWRWRVTTRLAPLRLSLNQYAVLACLAEFGALFHAELAGRDDLDNGDLVAVLDRLQRELLITRDDDNDDRRRVELRITSSGSRLLQRAEAELAECEEVLLSAFESSERAALQAALVRFLAADC
jgi:DNA-binding MarR family transcriptional regulator